MRLGIGTNHRLGLRLSLATRQGPGATSGEGGEDGNFAFTAEEGTVAGDTGYGASVIEDFGIISTDAGGLFLDLAYFPSVTPLGGASAIIITTANTPGATGAVVTFKINDGDNIEVTLSPNPSPGENPGWAGFVVPTGSPLTGVPGVLVADPFPTIAAGDIVTGTLVET